MIYDLHGADGGAVNTLIIFDFDDKIWTIHNGIWPAKLWNKGHALIQSKYDGVLLQTMGGSFYSNNKYCATTAHWCIKLTSRLDWSIERLLWIAYLKNDKHPRLCPVARLPKDIILFILQFLQKVGFVFN